MPEPIYMAQNCRFPGELKWGCTIFWRQAPAGTAWLPKLADAVKPDGFTILKHRYSDNSASQFEIESNPEVPPLTIVQRLKGRLQHIVQDKLLNPFRRKYAIRSVGFVTTSVIQNYVNTQLDHHRMADPTVQQRLKEFQIHQPNVNLSAPQATAHGRYWHNLHITVVHAKRWMVIREELLRGVRDMVLRVARNKCHRLAEAGILPDHIHLVVGCPIAQAPAEIACCYLNNLSFVHGMKPVFQFGAHLRTFSEYDLGAIIGEKPTLAPGKLPND